MDDIVDLNQFQGRKFTGGPREGWVKPGPVWSDAIPDECGETGPRGKCTCDPLGPGHERKDVCTCQDGWMCPVHKMLEFLTETFGPGFVSAGEEDA